MVADPCGMHLLPTISVPRKTAQSASAQIRVLVYLVCVVMRGKEGKEPVKILLWNKYVVEAGYSIVFPL